VRQPLTAADLRPVLERQVSRQDQALPLIGSADDLKQQFSILGEGIAAGESLRL